jgi:hypothetical protein
MRFKPQAANDYERRVTRRRKDGYDVSMEEMQPPRVAKTARFPRRRNYCGWRMHHAGTKTRVTKTAAKKSESTDQDSQQQRSFVICKPSYIDFIQRNIPPLTIKSHGPKSRQAKGQDRAQEVRICKHLTATGGLATDSFCHLGAQDPLVLRLATESSSPRRLLC